MYRAKRSPKNRVRIANSNEGKRESFGRGDPATNDLGASPP